MKNVLFDERQTLGSVRFWTSWRFAVVLFCVAAYFVSEERNRSEEGDLFLVVGTGVMLISILFNACYETEGSPRCGCRCRNDIPHAHTFPRCFLLGGQLLRGW